MKLMLGKFYAVITFLEISKMLEKALKISTAPKRMETNNHAAAYALGYLGHEFGKLFSARRVF